MHSRNSNYYNQKSFYLFSLTWYFLLISCYCPLILRHHYCLVRNEQNGRSMLFSQATSENSSFAWCCKLMFYFELCYCLGCFSKAIRSDSDYFCFVFDTFSVTQENGRCNNPSRTMGSTSISPKGYHKFQPARHSVESEVSSIGVSCGCARSSFLMIRSISPGFHTITWWRARAMWYRVVLRLVITIISYDGNFWAIQVSTELLMAIRSFV